MAHAFTVVRFLLVGVGNTVVGLAVIFAGKGLLRMGDVAANALGYAIGLTVSFTLNRAWTFRHGGPIGRSMVIFLLIQAVAYALNLVCVLGLIRHGVDSYLAQALGVPPYTMVSYLGSRYLAFPSKRTVTQNES